MTPTRFTPFSVPSEGATLANGLRVVVHEDRGSPIVAVHVMFHVGSKDERPGRTGLAHLLEHLLFEGTAHCPKGEFDRLLERVGGSNNGSTWLDRTNYYEVVPTHAVELALWLERERLGAFLPVLDEEMLEIQRDVVINERRQAYENRPYGLADERLHQLLFPDEHPYSWPTIGFMDDLHAIALGDARGFYETYYNPANAVLVLAGDVSPEDGFRLAERYFGDLPSGPAPRVRTPIPAPEPRDREAVLPDRVSFPRIYRGHAVPSFGTEDWVALDVLAYLLSDGESSRLQRTLVRDLQLAQDVDAYLYPTELHGLFGVVATARTGVEEGALRRAIDEVLAGVVEGGVTEEEVTGAIRRARRDQVSSMANVEERAEELAYAATVLGAPERLDEQLRAYERVTPEEVRRAAEAYLPESRAATVVVVPGKGERDE